MKSYDFTKRKASPIPVITPYLRIIRFHGVTFTKGLANVKI